LAGAATRWLVDCSSNGAVMFRKPWAWNEFLPSQLRSLSQPEIPNLDRSDPPAAKSLAAKSFAKSCPNSFPKTLGCACSGGTERSTERPGAPDLRSAIVMIIQDTIPAHKTNATAPSMAVKRHAPDDVVVTGYELRGAADPALARRAVERMS